MLRIPCLMMLSVVGIVVLVACGGAASVSTGAAIPTASGAPAPGAAADPFADLEQGTTPEGYHTLGKAAAPATLVMYSDFL